MSYENIRSDTPGFCCAGEYFYIMKPAPTNMLIQKTSYGDPVMTYPFSHEIDLTSAGTYFLSLQYDGINFWSLEKRNVNSNIEIERILRRWRIEDYMCVLKDSWRLRAQGVSESINGKAFVIENYHNILKEACGPGTSNPDRVKLLHPNASFFHVTDQFHLSSATQGYSEDIPVATVMDNYTVTTTQPIQQVYYPGDSVNLRRDLYFFNNASPALGDSSAAVYWYAVPHIDAADPTALNELTYKGCHDSGIYNQTQSATFITASGLDGINDGYYTGLIAYVRGQQLIMKRPNMPGGGLNYPGPNANGVVSTGFDYVGTNLEFRSNMASMIMDNAIKNDRVTLWTISDLAASVHLTECKTVNIYRLQTGYTYGALEGTWSTYNYVVSVMEPMVTSIALTAEPALVVANGVDRALIYATVRDQYGAALNYKRVVFGLSASDAQTQGYFLCPEEVSECVEGSFTWLDGTPHEQAEVLTGSQSSYPGGPPAMKGQAVIEWRAGTKAGLITVIAIVQP